MRKVGTRASALVLLMLGACDPKSRPPDDSASIEAPQNPAEAAEPGLGNGHPARPPASVLAPEALSSIQGAGITEASFARGVLYSWTSTATAARLRRTAEIFDDNQLPEGPTPYVRWLEHIASRDDASGQLARALLGHPDLRRRRYAWPRPFATRLGLGARDYGDQLLRVELNPRAIIGRFNPASREVWTFRDLDGRPVPLARALADPSRIGAILHIREGGADESGYREYVLCNESMIASWSLATPAIASAIAEDIKMLDALAKAAPLTGELERMYIAARAFDVPRYEPTLENLEAAGRALAASRQEGPALIVRPTRRFDVMAAPALVSVRRVPPRLSPII